MIRAATFNDLPAVFELGVKLKKRTPYALLAVDHEMALKTLRGCLSSANGCVYVAEHDGKITGTIVGVAEPLWYSNKRVATDLLLYSGRRGDGKKLMQMFLYWATHHPNIVDITLGQTSGLHLELSDEWYRKQGFERVGGMFQMNRFDYMQARGAA